jgi:hypothetical protein
MIVVPAPSPARVRSTPTLTTLPRLYVAAQRWTVSPVAAALTAAWIVP